VKQKIINFENRVAKAYEDGLIRAPIHLRSGREDQLIDIFDLYKIGPDDHIFAYWDSHDICLLKGVPEQKLFENIVMGKSIALSFPEHNILCSGIVGSLMGVAVGMAWALKHQYPVPNPGRVFLFCGDMSAETGIFHEAVRSSEEHVLSITFCFSVNGRFFLTGTLQSWGSLNYSGRTPMVHTFYYTNGWPHSGLGRMIKF